MSRIGRLPVVVPPGVEVKVNNNHVWVKGKNGEMSYQFLPDISIALEAGQVIVTRNSDNQRARALHGTTRALINNMVTGVSSGFSRVLEIQGVGYRAEMDEKTLVLFVGYSHPVRVEPPDGISFEVDAKTRQIKIMGYDKEMLGQVAADIRKIRPPEPYHGKGIRYLDEKVRRKAGKSAKASK